MPTKSALGVDPNSFLTWTTSPLEIMLTAPTFQVAIPVNQRPWSWRNKNLKRLLDDILRTRDHFFSHSAKTGEWTKLTTPNGNPHYLGTLVLLDREPPEVVDGQQRLTALCLLAVAIRQTVIDHIGPRATVSQKADAHRLEMKVTNLAVEPKSGAARLVLDSGYQPFFEQVILDPTSNSDRTTAREAYTSSKGRELNKVEKRLWSSFAYVLGLVERVAVGSPVIEDDLTKDPKERREEHTQKRASIDVREALSSLNSFTETMTDGFLLSSLTVHDEVFSFMVFSSLNATGTPLTDVDKIKNELFVASSLTDHNKVKDQWDAIFDLLPGGDSATFLRMQHLAFVGELPKSELYSGTKREIDMHSALPTLAKWSTHADHLRLLRLESHRVWSDDAEVALQGVQDLGATLAWPPLLAAYDKYLKPTSGKLSPEMKNFTKVARLVERIVFRMLTVGGQDVAELEKASMLIVQSITNAKPLPIVELKRLSPDGKFRHDMEHLSERRTKIQYYILSRIEDELLRRKAGAPAAPHAIKGHSKDLQIEHVLPQKLSKTRKTEWSWWRSSPDTREEWVSRLGNLLPLEGSLNGACNNYDFEAKTTGAYPSARAGKLKGEPRASYSDSSLLIIKEFLAQEYPAWTTDEISQWQKHLAPIAVSIWSLD